MKKLKPTTLRDELIKLLSIYTIIPMLFVVVVFILFLILYFNSAVVNTNKTNNYNINKTLETIIEDYSKTLDKIYYPKIIYNNNDKDIYINHISKDIVKFLDTKNKMGEFYILDSDFNVISSTLNEPPVFLPPYTGVNWGISQKLNTNLESVQYAFVYNRANYQTSRDLVIGKAITDNDNNILVYLIFDIPCEDLISLMSDGNTNFFIANKYNDVYISNSDIFIKWFKSAKEELLSNESFFSYSSELYYKFSQPAFDDNIIIYTTTPIKSYITLFLAYGGLFLLVMVIFYSAILKISNKITKDKIKLIDQIVSAFTSVQEGNLNVRMNIQTEDEFGIISQSYNLMLESLNQQIERNIAFAKETVLSEIKQLESQFNPHFLFNTLTTINYMINLEPSQASKMIISLSKILRYSIDNTIHNVTLEDDLSYVKNYISIEEIRFKTRLRCNFNIDNSTLDCIIPKLIFQPIIENSIIHGFANRDNLTINIKTFIVDDILFINLKDDGLGIDVDKLENIKKMLNNSTNNSKHIGLYNIDRRIKLIYGDENGLTINSELNVGTEINIKIPVRKDKDFTNVQGSNR